MHKDVLTRKALFSDTTCPDGMRLTTYVDMLFVLFTARAWECWRRHLDETNPDGWGYDLLYWSNCRMRMAIDDSGSIEHPTHTRATYSHGNARTNMHSYIQRQTNMTLAQIRKHRFSILRSATTCAV